MRGVSHVIGIDEVGRGPLAGPLCVGACLIPKKEHRCVLALLRGVRESKQLTEIMREEWFERIRTVQESGRLRMVTAFVGQRTIDDCGLAAALRLAIKRCLSKLDVSPAQSLVLLDGGISAPDKYVFQRTIIRGDQKVPIIAMASVVAKVIRDRKMRRLAKRFPTYGFDAHKGYGTRRHYEALTAFGPCEIHRKSFLSKFRISNT